MNQENINSPIFIVGSSRSGSSLLAAMLGAHSHIACGAETQLLPKIKPKQLDEILNDPEWPKCAVDQLSKLTLAGQRVTEIYNITDDEIYKTLIKKPRSIASLFESITENFAKQHNKIRWAEKTPRHLIYLDILRKEFPDAKIIRVVRDPRDSALSMRKLDWSSDEYFPNLYIWESWYRQSDKFFESDHNSMTIRYEDLMASPPDVLGKLCQFINEDYEAGMLETSKSGKLVSTPNERWKKQVSEKLDMSRCYRWKIELSDIENLASEFVVRNWLLKFGYETTGKKSKNICIRNFDTKVIEASYHLILSLAKHGYSMTEATKQDNLIFFGLESHIKPSRFKFYKICVSTTLRYWQSKEKTFLITLHASPIKWTLRIASIIFRPYLEIIPVDTDNIQFFLENNIVRTADSAL